MTETQTLYHFIREWPVDSLDRWGDERQKMNRVIHAFNEWQIADFDATEERRVRALIEWARQLVGHESDAYLADLDEMTEFMDERG